MTQAPGSDSNTLDIAVVAGDTCRLAKLLEAIEAAGLDGSVRRLAPTRKTCSYLARAKPSRGLPAPDLVFFDLAEPRPALLDTARRMSLGRFRSRVPLVLLTSQDSESVLASGELDDGPATMFAARPLRSFLAKLAQPGRKEYLQALATLYQYGPLLARYPQRILEGCIENHGEQHRLSA